jgi:Domain of unknown function (DUF4280)
MAEKHLVCHGAVCECNFGAAPDKLVVKSHKKEFINDKGGSKKMIATTKDIGATFKKNTFGPCKKQPIPGGHKPCQAVVTEWSGFYEKVTLENKGKILLEDSKATCPIGGKDCIKITFHGQVAAPEPSNAKNENKEVMEALNPAVDMEEFEEEDAPFYK